MIGNDQHVSPFLALKKKEIYPKRSPSSIHWVNPWSWREGIPSVLPILVVWWTVLAQCDHVSRGVGYRLMM
jgi:hypothetical protein